MSESESVERPADTMWERAGESRLKVWFLVSADRWLVVGAFSAIAFLVLVACFVLAPSTLVPVRSGNALGTVFSSVIIAIITSVTLVLTVAQLVLSEQIDELESHREHMEGEIGFRGDVESLRGIDVSPAQPAEFFRVLLAAVSSRAEATATEIREHGREEELSAVLEYLDGVVDHSRKTSADLEDARFGSFDVLLPVLNYNYAWKIHAGRSLRSDHGESLPPGADDDFEDLLAALRLFAPTREYFKSHYFQWEIVDVARGTLYGAVPALAVSAYVVLAFDPAAVTGRVLGVDVLYLVVSLAYVVVLLPFTVLLAYILRILTVVKRTLAIGPFVLRESELDRESADVE